MNNRLAIGRVKKSYGLKGYFKVQSFSVEYKHFLSLKEIYLEKENDFILLRIDDVSIKASNIYMKIAGIDAPEKVKEISGSVIWVDRKHASPLMEGEYYYADICSCKVYKNNMEIGYIRSILNTANRKDDILEVISPKGKLILIPYIDRFIGDVNIEERKIFIKEDFIIS